MVGSMPPGQNNKNSRISRAQLLAWYDVHRRVLPWRAPTGKRADPYRVWLSEIMLQQTTVQAVAAAITANSWPLARRAGPGGRQAGRGARPPGRGLAITPAPATCIAAAKVVAGTMGGKFPGTARRSARAAGGGRLYRRRDRRHRL